MYKSAVLISMLTNKYFANVDEVNRDVTNGNKDGILA